MKPPAALFEVVETNAGGDVFAGRDCRIMGMPRFACVLAVSNGSRHKGAFAKPLFLSRNRDSADWQPVRNEPLLN
jgi:hypothetical protein